MIEFIRTKRGKPELVSPTPDGAAVSLTHDKRYCVAAAGRSAQGVDIEVIEDRSPAEWRALLGPPGEPVFEQLTGSEPPGRAGTRIWSARECVYKALGIQATTLAVSRREGAAVLLHAQTEDGAGCQILTLPVTFTLGRERMLATIVESETEPAPEPAPPPAPPATRPVARPASKPVASAALKAAGFDPDSYRLAADPATGAFIVRWPVTLREGANLDRSVYFTQYADWMGKVRELAMQPIAEPFAAQLATGHWGMVTNRSHLTVLSEPRLGDVIETRYWVQRAPEQPRSTIDLHFEWRRIGRDGAVERAALGQMRTTWVALVGHGQARVEDFPAYFQDFIEARKPRKRAFLDRRSLPEPLGTLDRGALVFRRPDGPRRGPLLAQRRFETSLHDANAVGNVYFSTYYQWQARLADSYLQPLIPDAYRAGSSLGEMRCIQARVDHLADAMPFDEIEVHMSLEARHACSLTFGFDFFRVEADGSKRKLAVGEQECIWLADGGGVRRSASVPAAVVEDLARRGG